MSPDQAATKDVTSREKRLERLLIHILIALFDGLSQMTLVSFYGLFCSFPSSNQQDRKLHLQYHICK